jgi:opacity protein-like surface antigen
MKSFTEAGRFGSRALILAASALAAIVAGSTGASAQLLPPNCTGTVTGNINNIGGFGGSAGAVSATISGVIGSVNTAFLTQQGSAFVSAPTNPAPDQPGGGIWTRGLGGEVTTKSVTSNSAVATSTGPFGGTLTDKCNNSLHQYYSGVQVGTDIAKLNVNGWNFHLGTTAGFLGSTATDNSSGFGGLRTGVEVPFLGVYAVATYGRFFADVMVRKEYYNLNVDAPNFGLSTQPVGAHGYSISASAGYNHAMANNWFIEPSAGFIYSNTKVDSFNVAIADPQFGGTIGGTVATNDVTSQIGRLSVRVGTTVATPNVVYQPFVSASVFHEFAGDVVANFAFCPTCAFVGPFPVQFSQTSRTTRVGTYGQFSAGLAGQIVDTGWLGFVRADYKIGDNINGYAGNVGLRYQFAPDAYAAPVKYAKAPVKAPVAVYGTSNWTGFYGGVYAGAAFGRTDIAFANAPVPTSSSPYVVGPIGGVQAGYNHQVNNWVFGVEGDVGLARLHGGRPCGLDDGTGNVNGFNPLLQECNDRMNWMATLTGRLGYAYGRTLFYVKGGAAWADGRVKVDCIDATSQPCFNVNGNQYPLFNANGTETTYADYNRVGWVIGYGTEFDLGKNWSAKAEYDYTRFGKQTKLAVDGETLLYSSSSISRVKVGLNYRFGGETAVETAAPMYTKAPAKAPLVASIYDWRGFYVGANAGGAVASKNWEFFDEFGFNTPNGLPGFIGEGTHSASGPIIGGQAGYRGQSGRWVFGVEAQGDWARLRGNNVSIFTFSDDNRTNVDGLGIFTGQVGYTAFDTLLYVKGGAVVASERYNVVDTGTGALKATASDTRWGAAVGAGLEYGFTPNWTAGVDYVHGFLGSKTLDIPSVAGGIYETERIRQRLDLVTLRLNYKFGQSAVVAKY